MRKVKFIIEGEVEFGFRLEPSQYELESGISSKVDAYRDVYGPKIVGVEVETPEFEKGCLYEGDNGCIYLFTEQGFMLITSAGIADHPSATLEGAKKGEWSFVRMVPEVNNG